MKNQPTGDLSLHRFTDLDSGSDVSTYIAALEAFDDIPQLQELKEIERRRSGIGPGSTVLDVGCGFGLETLRIAERAGANGRVAGLDKSAQFIAEGQRRAVAAGLTIDYRVGDADALPYPDASYDCVRAERLLIYLHNWEQAIQEMRRVVRPGGLLSFIEPDFGTTRINLPDRAAVRRALEHETDTAVRMSWLPGPLHAVLRGGGFSEVAVATRVLVLPPELAHDYFAGVGQRAHTAGAMAEDQLRRWLEDLGSLRDSGTLFGSIGYFLFTARAAA